MVNAHLSFNEKTPKSFRVNNVEDITKLQVKTSPPIAHKIFTSEEPYDYIVNYEPVDEHVVNVSYNNQPVNGSPFYLAKKQPTIDHDVKNNIITVSGIDDPKHLNIESNTIPYSVYKNTDGIRAFDIKYDIPTRGVHDLDIKVEGKNVEGGSMRFVANELKDDYNKGLIKMRNGKAVNYRNHEPGLLVRNYEPQAISNTQKLVAPMKEMSLSESESDYGSDSENYRQEQSISKRSSPRQYQPKYSGQRPLYSYNPSNVKSRVRDKDSNEKIMTRSKRISQRGDDRNRQSLVQQQVGGRKPILVHQPLYNPPSQHYRR